MNDQQRMRLIILLVSGVMLAGGIYGWMSYNNAKNQEADMNEPTLAPHVRVAKKPDATSETPSLIADEKTGKTPELGDDGKPKPAFASQPTVPGAGKAVADKGETPTQAPAASPATKPAVATTTPAPTPAAVPTPAVKPAVATIPAKPVAAPVVKPAVATIPPKPVPVAAPVVKPAVATVPAKPALPNGPAIKPTPVATNNPNQSAFKPIPNAVPVNPRTAAHPTAIAVAPPVVTPPSLTAAPVTITPVATRPIEPGQEPVTTADQALKTAQRELGRKDPMQQLAAFPPFPRFAGGKTGNGGAAKPTAPPPPPEASGKSGPINQTGLVAHKLGKGAAGDLVPPPPPTTPSANDLDALDITQLPPPPSKPTIGDQLIVLAVIDDHAVITFPQRMREKNKWPDTISLGTGEAFESLKVVGVTPDGVTIEEDGERSLKSLAPIK